MIAGTPFLFLINRVGSEVLLTHSVSSADILSRSIIYIIKFENLIYIVLIIIRCIDLTFL